MGATLHRYGTGLTELLALDKVHLHKNNTLSVYHYCFIYLFYDQIRKPSSGGTDWITSVFFLCPGVRRLEEYVWRSAFSTAK